MAVSDLLAEPAPLLDAPLGRGRLGRWVRDPRPYLWLAAIAAVAPEFWHLLFVRGDAFAVDLHVYRLAGLDLLHHRPVYSWYYQTATATLPFTYPPIAAVLAVPMGALPARVDALIWFLGVYACLFWVLRLVLAPARARLRCERPWLEPLVLPGAWCASTYVVPGLQQVHLGQVGVFLLAIVAFDLLTPRTGRFRGALTGLAAAVKLTPLVFVVVFLAARRFREAALALGSFVLLAGLVWAVAPSSSKTFWTDTLWHADRLGDNTDPTNQSIRGALLRSGLPGGAQSAVWAALCLAVLAAGLLVTTQAWRENDLLLVAATGGFLACLLSPVAWIHHYVWIFLLVAWLARERHLLLAIATMLFWGWNWTASSRNHLLDHGLANGWFRFAGDAFCLYAVVAVVALARRAWCRAGGLRGARALVAAAPAAV